jgi:hypothetical protein
MEMFLSWLQLTLLLAVFTSMTSILSSTLICRAITKITYTVQDEQLALVQPAWLSALETLNKAETLNN